MAAEAADAASAGRRKLAGALGLLARARVRATVGETAWVTGAANGALATGFTACAASAEAADAEATEALVAEAAVGIGGTAGERLPAGQNNQINAPTPIPKNKPSANGRQRPGRG